MWQYLKAAFLASPAIPGLGRFPLNLVALSACAVLGFANAGFWFLGIGLEIGYLALLLSTPAFRRWVDQGAALARTAEDDPVRIRRQLLERLDPAMRQAQDAIESAAARVLEILRNGGADEFTVIASRDSLDRLTWTHLKLLVAASALSSGGDGGDLATQAAALERELAAPALPEAVRRSKQETLELVRRQAEVRSERARHLAEIAADRERIAAQLALARENAAVAGRPLNIASDLALASSGLDYGRHGAQIADIDRAYAATERVDTRAPTRPDPDSRPATDQRETEVH